MAVKKNETQKLASETKYYKILSVQNGLALSVEDASAENGALLVTDVPADTDVQSWKIAPAVDGTCRLVNKQTGKVADVIEGGMQSGAWMHQWSAAEAPTQLWEVEAVEGGYRFVSRASGKCMDIVGLSKAAGAHVQIWDAADGDNQLFKIELVEEIPAPQAEKPAAKKPAPKSSRPPKRRPRKKRHRRPL